MPLSRTPDWSSRRRSLHALQGLDAPPQGWVENVADRHLEFDDLITAAASGYLAAFPDGELVEFEDRGASYLFDLTDAPDADRTPRVVAAWGTSAPPNGQRDRSRQTGFPLPTSLAGHGYQRGHLLAHASGGGLDENLFPQATHINQGRSPAGRAYRRLERQAASHPGCLLFHRLIYGDGTDVPDLTQFTVALPGVVHAGTFDNRPDAWTPPPTRRLTRGQAFHRDVQTAFLAGLVTAHAQPERSLTLHSGRRRVDLLVLPRTDGEIMAVVVEIKNTDWDALRPDRLRPNLKRHLRQLQDYLDHYVDHLRVEEPTTNDTIDDAPGTSTWDSVIGVLLYPRQPTDPYRARLLEELALTEAITVVWYDQADWRATSPVQLQLTDPETPPGP